MRLIDADKLKELWEPIAKMDCLTGSVVQSCINELDKQPTIEVVPTESEFKRIAIQRGYVPAVRCGEWIECSNELNKKCSVCNKVYGTIYCNENFCPNCGAEMSKGNG